MKSVTWKGSFSAYDTPLRPLAKMITVVPAAAKHQSKQTVSLSAQSAGTIEVKQINQPYPSYG
jgi:hypothetical protein